MMFLRKIKKLSKVLRFLFSLLLLLFFTACGPHSLEDFREEGEGITRSLIHELQSIHHRDQLLAASSRLQRYFERLVQVIIAAKEFANEHPTEERIGLTEANIELSDQLRVELNRLYRIEGGLQIIEKCQESALHRLDAFEKMLLKQRADNQREND